MSKEGVKEKLKRQRARNVSFDLNRSSPQVKEKYTKDNLERRMPASRNANIIDMSETINAGKVARNTGAIPKNPGSNRPTHEDSAEEMPQSVKEMVSESVEDMRKSLDQSIREIVKENVSQQLGKVHESIAILSEAIRDLSLFTNRQNANVPAAVRPEGNELDSNARRYDFPANPRANTSRDISSGLVGQQTNPVFTGKSRVERFGLKFDGNDHHLPVESFIFRLEYFQRQYRIPWREIMDDFHLLVTGPASDWYWLYVETTPTTSWDSLRLSLTNRFKTHRTNLETMHELVERKQKPGESIDKYFYHLNLLRAKLEQPISEFELIKLAKKNLRESIGRVVYPIAVSSMEQLRVECVEAERHFSRRETREQPMRRYVNEIEYTSDNVETTEVEEINSTLTCWNCKQPGHTFVDCTSAQRELFCYKCGKPDTITPNCPSCKVRGNHKRGAITTGESRPMRNTPKH